LNRQRITSASMGFEWWYLHVITDQFSAALAVHTTDLLGGTVVAPYISVTIVHRGNRVLVDRVPFNLSEMSWTEEGHLTLLNQLTESTHGWVLTLRGRRWNLAGVIYREAPAWRTDDSMLVMDDFGHEMHWAVPLPRGRWNGELEIVGTSKMSAQGYAYQDHNWADCTLTHFVDGWSWHAVANENSTVIWANVARRSGRSEGFRLHVSRHSGALVVNNPVCAPLKREKIIKRREYNGDSGTAIYSRWLVRGQPSTETARGFSENLRVIASSPIRGCFATTDEGDRALSEGLSRRSEKGGGRVEYASI
jgi:hypothetical protein